MSKTKTVKLIASILIPQLAGLLGSLFTVSSVRTWYPTLNKPVFTPPSWLFAPVWTLLFLLMGIALYLVWQKGLEAPGVKKALIFFSAQLILNTLWSVLFFGFKSPLLGLLDIIPLVILIILTIISFKKINPTAGYLLIPYLLWTSFATILNLSLLILN
jgi:translocator protein